MTSREQTAIEALQMIALATYDSYACAHIAQEALRKIIAPPAQGSIDATVSTWQERLPLCPSEEEMTAAMEAEITALRAVLADRAAIHSNEGLLELVVAQLKERLAKADAQIERLESAARQSAAPGGIRNDMGFVKLICDYNSARADDSRGNDVSPEYSALCAFIDARIAPAPSEPVPQGVPEAKGEDTVEFYKYPKMSESMQIKQATIESSVPIYLAPTAPTATSGGEAVAGVRNDIVPGKMRCAKCDFSVIRTVLNVATGNAYAGDSKTEPCPNGCGPLWPITWEQEAREGYKLCDQLFERAKAAEDALAPPPMPATDAASLQGVPDRLQEAQANFSAGAAAAQVVPIIGVAAAAPTATDAEGVRKAMNVAAKMGNVLYNLAQRQGYVLTDADCEMYSNLRKEWDAIRALISKETT